MTFLDSIILGVVEGVTEFLPISSTAHLIITSKVLALESTVFLKSFEIAIQLGAICAVVFLYAKKIISSKNLWKKVIVAFIPTAIIGFVLYSFIKNVAFENITLIGYTLFIGGILMLLFEFLYARKKSHVSIEDDLDKEISYTKAFIIGLAQSLAVIPGVSRAAATIIGGLMLGVSRKGIVEFSFLLAVPTMAAATGYDLLKSAPSFTSHEYALLGIGVVVSFIFALISIKGLLKFISQKTFSPFAVYRLILGILVLFFLV